MNFKKHFIWYLENEKMYDIETLSIIRVLNKEHLWINHSEYVHQKLAPDLFFILVNNLKQLLHAINSFKTKIF